MNVLLTFAAWLTHLFFGLLSATVGGWFFVISGTFRRQAYARWARQSQLKTVEEIGEGAFGVAATLGLVAATVLVVFRALL